MSAELRVHQLLRRIATLLLLAAPAIAADPENCLLCHGYRGLSRAESDGGRVHLFFVESAGAHGSGPHDRLACTDCHGRDAFMTVPHAEAPPVDCTRTCHLADPGGLERRFSHQHIADLLQTSVHAPEVLDGVSLTRADALAPGQSRCLLCHDEPGFQRVADVLPAGAAVGAQDRCQACHTPQLPVDTGYYLAHVANRLQPARAPLEQAQICAVCHSDPQVRQAHDMTDAVASYLKSFHGKAALLDAEHTASCVDCHVARGANVHQMLARTEPASATHPVNIANSCRSVNCHPGADPALATAAVHMDVLTLHGSLEYIVVALFVLLTILTFGPSMLIVVLELFALVIGRHSYADRRTELLAHELMETRAGRRALKRFTVSQRVQHWVLVLLFTTLVVTGFPMKFAERAWAAWTIDLLGGLTIARHVHHWAGLALVVGMIAHLVYVAWTLWLQHSAAVAAGRRRSLLASFTALPMWLTPTDARKMFELLGYLLFLRRERPAFGRFGVKEKFEYIGVFWGTALLGLTGIMLWGEQLLSRVVTGRVLNIALIAHTYEAFLALIHVGILHIVNVIFAPNVFPLSPAMITGDTPPGELAENHGEMVAEVADALETAPAEGR